MGTFSDKCNGRWYEILTSLGMDGSILDGKPHPCPMCGGRDRFVWDNKDGKGGYFCRKCNPGYGFKLARLHLGLAEDDWQQVCEKIGAVLGETKRQIVQSTGTSDLDKYNRINQVLNESLLVGSAGLVARYLRGRGLDYNTRLSFHPNLYWYEEKTKRSGYAPAMIGRVVSCDDRLVSLHRTYLDESTGGKLAIDPNKKLMQSLPGVSGGAIRLFDAPADGVLGIAEGIETALSAAKLNNMPVWSVISATGMEAFVPPKNISLLMIFADNDAHAVGQLAAFKLKARLHKQGVSSEVIISKLNDFNDDLQEESK